eukprot:gene30299-35287_t
MIRRLFGGPINWYYKICPPANGTPLSRRMLVPPQYLKGDNIPGKLKMKMTKLTESQWKVGDHVADHVADNIAESRWKVGDHVAEHVADNVAESQWKLFCYSSLIIMGYFATASQPWFLQSKDFWIGWPHQEITGSMQVMYCWQMSYYVSSTWMLALWEIPRKDMRAMMLHHIATVILIALSRIYK